MTDTTRPYGFVDLNAKVWFAKYLDDGQNEREYLMTEGWLWTKQYPECQRILDHGNNHSMEFDPEFTSMTRTKGNNGVPHFFIVNEAIISKLCILGEDYEPCFETSSITAPTIQFAFSQGFEETMFSMMTELKELLDKGGTNTMTEEVKVPATEEVVENPAVEEPVVEEQPAAAGEPVVEEVPAVETPVVEEPVVEEVPVVEEPAAEEPAIKYNLEEIPEYVDLLARYSALEQENKNLQEQIQPLVSFKQKVERQEKEAMIARFSMLTEEDKADVIQNIDTYSLDDIEAKLSIICVRNKVSFASLDDDKPEETQPVTYNLGNESEDLTVPAWVKAALKVQQNMN